MAAETEAIINSNQTTGLTTSDQLQRSIEAEIPDLLRVPPKLINPDKLIKEYLSYIKINGADYRPSGRFARALRETIDINVNGKLRKRAVLVMDTLIKVLRYRGYDLVIRNGLTYVRVRDIQVRIYLKEKEKKVINVDKKRSFNEYLFVSTGKLYLHLGRWSQVREFNDNKMPLESQIAKIVATLVDDVEKEEKDKAERQKHQAEVDRLRQIEEDIQNKKRQEKWTFKSLLKNSMKFHKTQLMRNYINEVKQKAITDNSLNEELSEWIEWANRKADEYDPTLQLV